MKKFISIISSNTALYIYGIFFIFILWYVISISQGYGNLIFPTPIETAAKTGEILSKAYIYKCIGMTFYRTLLAFSLSFLAALILGFVAGTFPKFRTFMRPLIILIKAAPTAAFVFLFLVLSGTKYASVYIVIMLAFPILYEAVVSGLTNIPSSITDALKIDSSSVWASFFRVKLPLGIPYILLGLTSSFALSFKTAIMAEIVSGDTNYGLGCAINSYRSSDPTNMTPIFSVALIAIVIILIIDLLSYFAKKKIDTKIDY